MAWERECLACLCAISSTACAGPMALHGLHVSGAPVALEMLPQSCEHEYRVEDLGYEPRTLDHVAAVRAYAPGPTSYESGPYSYVVRWTSGDGARDATLTVDTGVGVVSISEHLSTLQRVTPDGHGALLLQWTEYRGRHVDRQAIVRGTSKHSLDDVPTLDSITALQEGWLGAARTEDGRVVVYQIDARGGASLAAEAMASGPRGGVRAAEGHGGLGVVDVTGSGFRLLQFTSEGTRHYELVEAEARHATLDPRILVADERGWWVGFVADWDRYHFAEAPDQWRFFHVSTSGELIGRAHVRFGLGAGAVELVPLASGVEARIEVMSTETRRTGRYGTHRLRFGPSSACVEPGPCDARRAARTGPAPTRAELPWVRGTTPDGPGSVLRRLDEEGNEVAGYAMVSGIGHMSGYAESDVHTWFLELQGPDWPRQLLLSKFDRQSGEASASHSFPGRAGCVAADGDSALVGIASEYALTLYREDGTELWSTPQSWSDCSLVVMEHGILFAGAWVEVETSGGPIGMVRVHVLSRDGTERRAVHNGGWGMGFEVLNDESSAWIVWRYSLHHWDLRAWRFDASLQPVGSPHALAPLYFRPTVRLMHTEFGPSLVWSTAIEEGVMPLCQAGR